MSDDYQLLFNFDLDDYGSPDYQDDYPVIVEKIVKVDCICTHCNELYPYADGPNQKDGTFKCYSCRITG